MIRRLLTYLGLVPSPPELDERALQSLHPEWVRGFREGYRSGWRSAWRARGEA